MYNFFFILPNIVIKDFYLYLHSKEKRMNIFELKNFQVSFSPQALAIKQFKEIWDTDPSEDKSEAIKELSYVYYMADDRSDYMYELNEDIRSELIKKDIGMDTGWIRPKYIDDAISYYRRASETTSTKLLESTRGVIQKISNFLDTVDPNERDKAGKPVFPIAQIVSAVEKMPKLVKALNDVEKEVIKEKELKGHSGNRDVGVFDDTGI
jgi:hypothetical protein